ncbi:hypothetical protein JCM33374_g3211 [Metschnikowia sp. JCM 33374]|nr:hypothetical protein JCM33374_g3211 [Metschnikowia sp. JCM 33374]
MRGNSVIAGLLHVSIISAVAQMKRASFSPNNPFGGLSGYTIAKEWGFEPDWYTHRNITSISSTTTVEKVEMLIGRFVVRVKALLEEALFENSLLDKSVTELRYRLQEILAGANTLGKKNDELSAKVGFSAYLVRAIEKSSGFFEDPGLPENSQHFADSIFHLNCILLTSYSVSSGIEAQLSEFAGAMSLHMRHLRFWRELLKYLADVPISLRLNLESQYTDAEEVFRALTCDYPKEKKPEVEYCIQP